MAKKLSKAKAKAMLRHGKVHGKKLTHKQKRKFSIVAGGQPQRKK